MCEFTRGRVVLGERREKRREAEGVRDEGKITDEH
jgi:hypothetical protein